MIRCGHCCIPMIWIMNEAKTTTHPQPPSGGVGRSPDDSSVEPEEANEVPSASAAAAAPSFFMSVPDSAATMKKAPSNLSSPSPSSAPSSSSSCVVGSVRVNSELFLLHVAEYRAHPLAAGRFKEISDFTSFALCSTCEL